MYFKKLVSTVFILNFCTAFAAERVISFSCPETLTLTEENIKTKDYNAALPESLRRNGVEISSPFSFLVPGTYVIYSSDSTESKYSAVRLVASGYNGSLVQAYCSYYSSRNEPLIISVNTAKQLIYLDSVNVTPYFTTYKQTFNNEPIIVKTCSPYDHADSNQFNEERCKVSWRTNY